MSIKTINLLCLCAWILLSSSLSTAQDKGCATVMSPEKQQWLRSFQLKLDNNTAVFQKNGLVYVPVQIHVVRKSDGTSGLRPELVQEALCKANSDFAPAGMYFYMANPVNFINDDLLWRGESGGIFTTADEEKVPNVVNIYFHGFSDTWCGVYFPFPDIVLVQNSCANYGSSTLTHELGHFFSLPHTFSGWEGGTTPPLNERERIDKSNCRSAGDGFCDTGPDYVSRRWSCPLTEELTDPLGIPFRPTPDFFMNYALDACHKVFSNEQILAMKADLTMRAMATAPVDTTATQAPQLLSPINGDSLINPALVTLVWSKVPGAVGYHVQVSRFQYWQEPHVNQICNDTTLDVTLLGEWPFDWRVKAIMPGKTCGAFDTFATFKTKTVPLSSREIVDVAATWKIFPNPVKQGEWLNVEAEGAVRLDVYDLAGKLCTAVPVVEAGEHVKLDIQQGAYLVKVSRDKTFTLKKLIVW
ncbi:MAG: zinc-dependent metalloprotease [Bacteroidota bacterium]|jgi:hypothetical protein